MKLSPVNNCVVVKPTQQKMQDGAFFCSQQNNDVQTGVVVATSSREVFCDDTVIFFKYNACPFTLEGENYLIVNADDILACVLEDWICEE